MFACLDYETPEWSKDQLELYIKFGFVSFYDGKKRRNVLVHNANETMRIIETFRKKYKKPYLIFSHNLDFEFKFLVRYLNEHYQIKVIDNGNIFSIKVYRKHKKRMLKICEFRNSYRLFPMSLEKLGKAINLYKLKQDYNDEENPNFLRYCRRDNDIVMKGLKYLVKFFNSIGYNLEIEKMPLTFPSIAYKIFHFFNTEYERIDEKSRKKNQLTNVADWINEYFRNFYFGGRTEVFHLGIFKEVAYLDFNSLYPFIMITYKFPKPKYWKVKDNNFTEKTFAVLCNIDESREYVPIIAEKKHKKLKFTASKKTALITIEEYHYISLHRPNTSITITERWECDAWITPFEYMMDLYEKRLKYKENENPFELFIKLVMNSTYGKFAERSLKLNVEFYNTNEITKDFAKQKISKCKTVKFVENVMILYNETHSMHMNINVPYAHRITALARLKLIEYVDILLKKGIVVIYCDTDSIVINTKNLSKVKNILSETKLGMMKIEHTYRDFCALAPKEYLFSEQNLENKKWEYKQKAKGISDGSLNDYYFNNVSFVRPIKFREAIKRKLEYENAIEIKKHKSTFYDKRIINKDFSTIPITNNLNFQESNKNIIINQMKSYQKHISQ